MKRITGDYQVDLKLSEIERNISNVTSALRKAEQDKFVLSILNKFVIHSYVSRFPKIFRMLRLNYDLISQVIQETTLGVGTPLYQLYQNLKNMVNK